MTLKEKLEMEWNSNGVREPLHIACWTEYKSDSKTGRLLKLSISGLFHSKGKVVGSKAWGKAPKTPKFWPK